MKITRLLRLTGWGKKSNHATTKTISYRRLNMTACLTDSSKARHGGFITPSSKTWSQKCSPGAPGVKTREYWVVSSTLLVTGHSAKTISLKFESDRGWPNWPGFPCGKKIFRILTSAFFPTGNFFQTENRPSAMVLMTHLINNGRSMNQICQISDLLNTKLVYDA